MVFLFCITYETVDKKRQHLYMHGENEVQIKRMFRDSHKDAVIKKVACYRKVYIHDYEEA